MAFPEPPSSLLKTAYVMFSERLDNEQLVVQREVFPKACIELGIGVEEADEQRREQLAKIILAIAQRESDRDLAARGFFKGRPDGKLADELKDAIESFERASAMPVTGLATRHLLQVLAGESDVVTGKIPPQQIGGAVDRSVR